MPSSQMQLTPTHQSHPPHCARVWCLALRAAIRLAFGPPGGGRGAEAVRRPGPAATLPREDTRAHAPPSPAHLQSPARARKPGCRTLPQTEPGPESRPRHCTGPLAACRRARCTCRMPHRAAPPPPRAFAMTHAEQREGVGPAQLRLAPCPRRRSSAGRRCGSGAAARYGRCWRGAAPTRWYPPQLPMPSLRAHTTQRGVSSPRCRRAPVTPQPPFLCSVRLSLRRPSPAPAAQAVQGVVAMVWRADPAADETRRATMPAPLSCRKERENRGGCSLRRWLVRGERVRRGHARTLQLATRRLGGVWSCLRRAVARKWRLLSVFRDVLSGHLNLASMSEICNRQLVHGADVIAIVARNHLADGLLETQKSDRLWS
jgi:hypothetical protein